MILNTDKKKRHKELKEKRGGKREVTRRGKESEDKNCLQNNK